MPKTLLVVDDSATMRKVFELTFGGEDINVVTHEGGDSVLARAREARPDAAVVDVNLGGPSGYDVARSLKGDASLGGMPVLLLFSEQSPVDEARVRESGADGTLQKPFDTQACIDRIRQLLGGAPAATAGAAPAATAGSSAARPTAAVTGTAPPPAASRLPPSAGVGSVGAPPAKPAKATQMFGPGSLPFAPPAAGPASTAPARPAAPAPPPAMSRDSAEIELTVDGEEEMSFTAPPAKPAPAPAPARPAMPAPTAAPARPAMSVPSTMSAPARPAMSVPSTMSAPAARSAAAVPASTAAPVAAISAEVGQRVAAMGLTPAQVEAVTALTREVVERVVWEVVPQLAETLIREEIRRLTAE